MVLHLGDVARLVRVRVRVRVRVTASWRCGSPCRAPSRCLPAACRARAGPCAPAHIALQPPAYRVAASST
eukprot:scaffold107067_cov33-Phaeocystis_antarctica.AAC.1